MRKLLLTIIIFTLSLLGQSVYAQIQWNDSIAGKKEDILLKEIHKGTSTGAKDGSLRSIVVLPVAASLCDNALTIDFLFPLEADAMITVANLNTGETVHSGIYPSNDPVFILLDPVRSNANYRIDITCGSWILEGKFVF